MDQTVVCFCVVLVIFSFQLEHIDAAMTMKQLQQSMAMFREKCSQKTQVSLELITGIQRGEFPEVKELKCYTLCIAQMTGTLTKKNELIEAKAKTQIDTLLPTNLREAARGALDACKDIQYGYKDSCDKLFFTTKCIYEYNPKDFLYP